MKYRFFSLLTIAVFSVFFEQALYGQSQTNDRAQWFVDARFGMFIHWGVYSGAEGYWKGEKLRNNNDYAEWLLYRNRIEKNDYLTLLDRFDWDSIDPEEWVLLAKRSGMKYVTLTAKHHDGFGLWDSKVSNYDLGDYTNPKRDIVGELAEACRKHGLKLGLYYSHWVDWEHEFGWDHTKEIYPITAEQYDQYWQEKVMPQMRELLTNYGDIGMIWFDMWIHHSQTIVTKEQLLQLKSLIRELQPNCLVNSRLGLSVEEDPDVDYRTLGDNQLGSKRLDYPWQSPGTVAHSWGYHQSDTRWKSTTALLKALIGNVSLNGNYMLNIGPRSNGDVPFEISERMLEMGQWLEINGASLYGAEAFDLDKDQHDWGKITYKQEGYKHQLFLHVYNWPFNQQLHVTGITDLPVKAYALSDKAQSKLNFTHQGAYTNIQLSEEQPDPYVSVIVLEYDQKPTIEDGLVAKTFGGGYNLNLSNTTTSNGEIITEGPDRNGTVPIHWEVPKTLEATWKVYVDTPGKLQVEASYAYQGEKSDAVITVSLVEMELSKEIVKTGLTVGEPNRQWHIDNFVAKPIGTVEIKEAGYYTVSVKIANTTASDPVKFQWLWLAQK